jgi:hypothetical protein
MNQFVFYLEVRLPDAPLKRLYGTLRAADGAAARKAVDAFLEEVAKDYAKMRGVVSIPAVVRVEINGVLSQTFQVWSL